MATSEKVLLKRATRRIQKKINKTQSLLRLRQKVKDMQGRLEDLQYQVEHPDWKPIA